MARVAEVDNAGVSVRDRVGRLCGQCIHRGYKKFHCCNLGYPKSSRPGANETVLGTRRFGARWLLITFLCGILIWPGVHMRRGHLDIEELENFPAKLKLALQVSTWLTAFGFAWMWVTYGFIKA